MDNELAPFEGGELSNYEPQKGLKRIAVAAASERHWARARNAEKLLEAMTLKLREQHKFVVWYDAQSKNPGNRYGDNSSVIAVKLASLFELDPEDERGIQAAGVRDGRDSG